MYSITTAYHPTMGTSLLTVKVFLSGQKNTPLVIDCLTFDDYIVGGPLKSGVQLFNTCTNATEEVNLNKPTYIRQFILQGQKHGWTGMNDIGRQNGLDYLNELGFHINQLQP